MCFVGRSCAEGEDSETENSLRKSVSFCEDVDVVNIKTTTTKAARKSAKKSRALLGHFRFKNASGIIGFC